MRFAVAIPTDGARPDLLRRTLHLLQSCSRPPDFAGVHIVENGGQRASGDVVAEFQDRIAMEYVHLPERGKSNALNRWMHQADVDFILFLDDDVRVGTDLLNQYSAAARSYGSGHFFGGPTAVDYEVPPATWLEPQLPRSARGFQRRDASRRITTPCFLGFNWGAFRRDILELGGFDVRFGPGAVTNASGQEMNMQARMLERGLEAIYLPDAVVWHYVSAVCCTEPWVLARKTRHGLAEGITRRDVGRWEWVKGLTRLEVARLKHRAAAVLSKDQQEGFAAACRIKYIRGYRSSLRVWKGSA